MNLVNLNTFRHVARLQSFTAAAAEIGVSQQCTSARIKSLERELGFCVVRHDLRHFRLTLEGEAVVKHAEAIVNQVEVLRSLYKKKADPFENGVLAELTSKNDEYSVTQGMMRPFSARYVRHLHRRHKLASSKASRARP